MWPTPLVKVKKLEETPEEVLGETLELRMPGGKPRHGASRVEVSQWS